MLRLFVHASGCIAAALLAAVPVQAEDSLPAFHDDLTVEQLTDVLDPEGKACDLPGQGCGTSGPSVACAASNVVLSSVTFEFNSSKLSDDTVKTLRRVRAALSSDRLLGSSFLVIGHTDAVGSAAYNMVLSERRANSVVDLLNAPETQSISLRSEGKGESQLLEALEDEPDRAEHRRVEIRRLSNGVGLQCSPEGDGEE